MISLATPEPEFARQLLGSAGAFGWWYLDALDHEGTGVVAIVAFGLPFLPRAAAGSSERAIDQPSLNVAVYERGRLSCYLLQKYGPNEATLAAVGQERTDVRLGASRLTIGEAHGAVEARLVLDAPMPYSKRRLSGVISVSGPSTALVGAEQSKHVWWPRTAHGWATAALRAEGLSLDLDAPGYADSNFSQLPLGSQGIADWSWGRVSFGSSTFVYYLVTPDGAHQDEAGVRLRVLEQRKSGEIALHGDAVHADEVRRGRYGVSSPRRFRLATARGDLEIRARHVVDDGPFYQRFLLDASLAGERAVGVGEHVVPSRVDIPWQRRFVRMRVHHTQEPNSPLLALFSGSRAFRSARFARALFGEV